MKGIPNTERQRLGALLDHETQETVMAICGMVAEALELAKAQRLTPLESSSRGMTSYSSASK